MFRNMSTRSKIMILAGGGLFLLLTIAGINWRSSLAMQSDANELYDNFNTPVVIMSTAANLERDIRQFITMLIVTDDQEYRNSLYARLPGHKEKAASLIETYRANNLTNEARRRHMDEMLKAREKYMAAYERIVDLAMAGKDEESYDYFISAEVRKIESDYFNLLDDVIATLDRVADARVNEALATGSTSIKISLAISLLAVISSLALGLVIANSITKPVNKLKSGIEEFSKGDLTVELESSGRDEIAQMSSSLKNMSNSLNRAIGAANNAGNNISEAAHDFSAMAEETNASVEEFRSSIEEMSSNLDNLASTSEQVNASIQEVATGAQTTAEKGTQIARKVDDAMTMGNSGMQALNSVAGGIEKIAKSSVAATNAATELGNRARQIQDFVSQIGGIADQTNLLALNAAIEAARAGAAGKGFAVVAEEVRKLAEDSNSAAKNIASLADAISLELGELVDSSRVNAEDSSQAKTFSEETLSSIGNIMNFLQEIAGATQDLAAIAQEQAASSQEIAASAQQMAQKISDTADAGENIRTGVAEVAAASERVALGAENLSGLSVELQEELSFFKLKDFRDSMEAKDRVHRLKAS